MYANDLQIYIRCPLEDLHSISNKMRANAGRIMSWATQNHLRLNVGKTKAIVIGTPYYINRLSSVARSYVDIGGVKVVYESSLRILGEVLDSKLSWKEHTAHLSHRIHSLMYRLYHFRKSTNLRLRKHLIQMLLFPIIDYCCEKKILCSKSTTPNI